MRESEHIGKRVKSESFLLDLGLLLGMRFLVVAMLSAMIVVAMLVAVIESMVPGGTLGPRQRGLDVDVSMARIKVREAQLVELEWRLRKSSRDAIESRDRDRALLEREKRVSHGRMERLDWVHDELRWMDERNYFQSEAIFGSLQDVRASCEGSTGPRRHSIPVLVFDKKDRNGRYMMYGRD